MKLYKINEASVGLMYIMYNADGIASFFSFLSSAAACVSMYQAGGVVGTILIGYSSDLLIKQVCVTLTFVNPKNCMLIF